MGGRADRRITWKHKVSSHGCDQHRGIKSQQIRQTKRDPGRYRGRERGLTLPVWWESIPCFSPHPSPPHYLPHCLPPASYHPHPSSSPLSAALRWLFGLLGAYQAHRSMFPSNAAFILSLPWQLPISPKESAGSVFPWRWHGDIARQLWTACWDSVPFLLSSSHPVFPSVLLFADPFASFLSLFWQQPLIPWAYNS